MRAYDQKMIHMHSFAFYGGILIILTLASCAPLDQRYFDPQAGRPPKALSLKPKTLPNMVPKKSFIEIVEGTSEENYGPEVEKAAKIALERKKDILFIVESVIPASPTPDQDLAHLESLNKNLLLPVTHHLRAAGAQPIQIDMRSETDMTLHQAMIRINVR